MWDTHCLSAYHRRTRGTVNIRRAWPHLRVKPDRRSLSLVHSAWQVVVVGTTSCLRAHIARVSAGPVPVGRQLVREGAMVRGMVTKQGQPGGIPTTCRLRSPVHAAHAGHSIIAHGHVGSQSLSAEAVAPAARRQRRADQVATRHAPRRYPDRTKLPREGAP